MGTVKFGNGKRHKRVHSCTGTEWGREVYSDIILFLLFYPWFPPGNHAFIGEKILK